MKNIFLNKQRKFSIRKLTVGTISVAVGLVFINDVTGMSRVEAALSVEDSNYINETAVSNGALVEYIRQALATISKAANSTVLPSSIQNLKDKVQALSTKKEVDYTETAWQAFQGKLTTAKSVLAEAEKAYNNAVMINPNAQSYEATINELTTSYPEYNTVVIRVRDGETTEAAENRHLTNIRRINQVLTAKYAELKETAQLVKSVLPPVGGDIAAQQLEIINSAENILELNKKEATFAQAQHTDLMAGLLEHHKVTLSNLSNLRGNITSEDQAKIKAFLESHNPSAGETDVFQAFSGALGYKFNNDGTITITYTDDGSSDTVPLSIFAKGGSTQTDSPAATYSVTYNYVSGTPDKTLPSNITAPAVVSDKHTGDVVASPSGQTDVEDAANQGTWHFNGWGKSSVTIGTANETVTGTWNFVPTPPAAIYSVTYNYVSGTPDKNLPSNITAPAAVNDKHTGDVVASPTGQTDVEDTANQGIWHFNGWDKASVTIGTANEVVTGTWNFVPTPPAATYTVTYNYVSGTPDKNLPSSITAPAVVSDKHTGDVVASPSGQTDVEDAVNQGTWHFNGWDKASVTVGTANEVVTGTWNFVPTPPAATYTVTYNYVSGTPDKNLPSSITAPAVVSDKHTGDVVASPSGQTDVEDAVNQGTWHFNGWDKASVTVGTANEVVTGTWNFVPTPPAATYTVTYNYVSGTPDKNLPSSITAPAVVSDKHTGDVVASPTGQTDVEDTANQGTWRFNGWDKASVTIGTANEAVTGTWNFVPTPPAATYTVTYNYVSGTPDKTLPSSITAPAVVSDKHTGDVVASPSGQIDVEDTANQGTWRFNGWDKASVTIGTANEAVTGTWNFVPTPPAATYTVTYNYVSGTPDKTLPSSITAPAVVSDKHTGDVVASPSGQIDVEDTANQGTWHFNGWDKPSVTIGAANETVTGTWTFTATLGENPSTTPGTATPGENPSTTPGTTPGTETPGGNPEMPNPPVHELPEFNGGVPGIPEVHDKPEFNVGVSTPGTSTTSNPRGTTPRTTYLFVTSKEDKTLPNSVVEGWSKKDSQWLYQLEDGSHIVNEWKQINGTWYHFDNSGVMQTGWIKENGTWYYLNKSGAMQTGWVKENGTWYYLNDSGAMQTGWVKENGTWYYLNQSGSMETGWFTVSDKWYYANESGALAINTTTPDGYTVNADGEWVE